MFDSQLKNYRIQTLKHNSLKDYHLEINKSINSC